MLFRSLAPFAILAPLVGPYIDRLPGGRRLTVFVVGLARALVVILMVGRIESLLLFPLAFISLVLSKIYAVSRSSLVPTLVRSDDELVAANGKLGLVVGVVSFVAVIPAGLAHNEARSRISNRASFVQKLHSVVGLLRCAICFAFQTLTRQATHADIVRSWPPRAARAE